MINNVARVQIKTRAKRWEILLRLVYTNDKREGSGSYLSDGKYNSDWFILSLADLSNKPGILVW